jgi:N-acetylglucosaminyldiphosphoundecaprenol N-acetyl-beta-D-mannosaminyltransferase
MIKTVTVLDIPLACVNYASAVKHLQDLARQDHPAAVCAANTHILALSAHDAQFGNVIKSFDFIVPDGTPLVWCMNRLGAGLKERVYGPYLMQESLRQLGKPWKHFFFGGTEECLHELVEKSTQLNPDINIVGTFSPPFGKWSEADQIHFAEVIQAKQPDFIWVALGGGKQETWIHEHLHRHPRGVFLAVGDAFELIAGRRPFAPAWMQKSGLTWVYRLWQEPRRMLSRYVKFNSLFLYYLIRSKL